jgi:hypothetical protein
MQYHAFIVKKNVCAEVLNPIFNLNFNIAASDKKADE